MSEKAPLSGDPGETGDERKAVAYFESKLGGERRIEISQAENCRVGIVVPSYHETPERILEQIESLARQEGIEPQEFEVIYVVNNGKDEKKEVIERNQAVLDLPVWKNRENRDNLKNFPDEQLKRLEEIRKRLNLFVIDKSSQGSEIENCNVGKARNRGVAEESKRFYENGKNGIIIQTDADSRFEDREYLNKVKALFDVDPSLIAVSGGFVYEFNPDAQNPAEREQLKKEYEDLIKLKSIKRMTQFVWRRDNPQWKSPSFNIGEGNMISRSFETAVVGGLENIAAGEDTQFGKALETYARERGKNVVDKKSELVLVTALRESDRTPVQYKTFSSRGEKGERFTEKPFVEEEEAPLVTVEEAYVIAREEVLKTEEGKKLVESIEGPEQERFRRPN